MKKISKLVSTALVLIGLILCLLTCAADTPECKLAVLLENSNKQAIDGITVYITKIADINSLNYYPAAGFEESGISISGIVNNPSAETAINILDFVKKNNIASLMAESLSGKAQFNGLDTGIWLVYCGEDGGYSFNPYIVFLPYAVNGELHYEMSSAPKTDINSPNDKSIYVVKKWEDKNNAAGKRPGAVTVELKHNGSVIASVELNERNGWAYTFSELPDEGSYEVREKEVKDYSAKYSGDSENGFIVTNTYNGEKLPQTGQLWWPIAVVAVVGVLFVLLGIIELGAHKNEKKNK